MLFKRPTKKGPWFFHICVSKNRGGKTPKMDGFLKWKTLLKWDDLGGKTHYFQKHPYTNFSWWCAISNVFGINVMSSCPTRATISMTIPSRHLCLSFVSTPSPVSMGLLTLKRAGRSRCPCSLPCSRCPCRDLGCVSSWRIKRACRIASVLMWRLHWSCSEACIPFTKTAGASGSCIAASPNRRMKYARLGPRPVNNKITKK